MDNFLISTSKNPSHTHYSLFVKMSSRNINIQELQSFVTLKTNM